MVDFIVFVGLLVAVVGLTVWMVKRGHIKDTDGDLIPDVVEKAGEALKDVAEDVVSAPKRAAKKATTKKTTKKATSAKQKTTTPRKPRGKGRSGSAATDVQESIGDIDKI